MLGIHLKQQVKLSHVFMACHCHVGSKRTTLGYKDRTHDVNQHLPTEELEIWRPTNI
jgi:hypothetical protein